MTDTKTNDSENSRLIKRAISVIETHRDGRNFLPSTNRFFDGLIADLTELDGVVDTLVDEHRNLAMLVHRLCRPRAGENVTSQAIEYLSKCKLLGTATRDLIEPQSKQERSDTNA